MLKECARTQCLARLIDATHYGARWVTTAARMQLETACSRDALAVGRIDGSQRHVRLTHVRRARAYRGPR